MIILALLTFKKSSKSGVVLAATLLESVRSIRILPACVAIIVLLLAYNTVNGVVFISSSNIVMLSHVYLKALKYTTLSLSLTSESF